jgi:dihydrodipicolinate reductase
MTTHVVALAGKGKLAEAIQKNIINYLPNCAVVAWEEVSTHKEKPQVIVHVGSGRQLNDIINCCNKNQIVLIQGSTGLEYQHAHDFTFIDAPNFDILMLKFMYMLSKFGKHFAGNKIEITESHQHVKTSTPGTAITIAKYLGRAPNKIKSIRETDKQLNEFKISPAHLDKHAMHIIKITDHDSTITMRTDVAGHESYVSGLAKIIIASASLEKRYYNVVDLIELNLI